MAKQHKQSPKKPAPATSRTEIPPGATRQALDRVLESGGGPPGSAAGPRHAADHIGSEGETFGPAETTRTPASPPLEEEDPLEKGPPYAGKSGGAVGGTPAQLRSSEGSPRRDADLLQSPAATTAPAPARIPPEARHDDTTIRLVGFAAIEYAEKQGLSLNKHPDPITGPRLGLNIAEALAIADEDPDLIWLDVAKDDYYSGPPSNYEPER